MHEFGKKRETKLQAGDVVLAHFGTGGWELSFSRPKNGGQIPLILDKDPPKINLVEMKATGHNQVIVQVMELIAAMGNLRLRVFRNDATTIVANFL